MVIADLDVMCSIGAPDEADPPLVVDTNAVLSGPVMSEPLQSVSRWASQIFQGVGCVQHEKLPVRLTLNFGSQPGNPLTFEDPPRERVPKAADHAIKLSSCDNNGKRYYHGAG